MNKFLLGRIGVANEYSAAPPTVHDCIEMVIPQADSLMRDVLEGLASSIPQKRARSSFGDPFPISKAAIDFLCSQSSVLEKTFVAHLQLGIYNPQAQDLPEQLMLRFEDLQLLDSKQIDASIEFALALQEVSRCVSDVLPSLDALISSLLGWITVQPSLNPLKAEVFVRALQACLKQHVLDEQVRAALLLPAAGLLGVSLGQLYGEISDWLRSQGVEPAAPVGTRLCGGGLAPENGPKNSLTRTLATLDKLRRLLAGQLDGAVAGSGLQDFSHTVPASYVALEDLKLVEPLMKRLAQRASLSADVAISLEPAGQRISREPTQGKQLGKQLGEEVVRLMLDKLMQDKRLLASVRELIKKLEPVLLTLARSDPRFFSERQHPARQFLDRVTDRSLAYRSENDAAWARFLAPIERAVEALNGKDGEAALFAQVLHKLEDDWSRDQAMQRQQDEEAARALWQAQQRELLAQRFADDFGQRQKNQKIPQLVNSFLRGPWAQVVAQSQLRAVAGSVDPDGYLTLVDDLIWSAQPRLGRRERLRLLQLVPALLVKLRQGLQLIDYPEQQIAVFFDALVSVHEKVFQGPRLPATGQSSGQSAQAIDETGVWIELRVNEVWLRAQLVWASPHRSLFMFVSRGGLAHSMSRRSMERLRQQGSIRFVSEGHLVEQVLDAAATTALRNDPGPDLARAPVDSAGAVKTGDASIILGLPTAKARKTNGSIRIFHEPPGQDSSA